MAADGQRERAAAVVVQALGLDADPADVAEDAVLIKRDSQAAIYAIELASSAGDAAFLVYVYDLAAGHNDGRTGPDLFEDGIATLREAAANEAPGPRLLAHAATDAEGFILATTPATFRALVGEPSPAMIRDGGPTPDLAADPAPTDSPAASLRQDTPLELLRLLRDADALATTWLASLDAPPRAPDAGTTSLIGRPPLSAEETALALFLLDDQRGIRNLLRLLNLLLADARGRATGTLAPDRET